MEKTLLDLGQKSGNLEFVAGILPLILYQDSNYSPDPYDKSILDHEQASELAYQFGLAIINQKSENSYSKHKNGIYNINALEKRTLAILTRHPRPNTRKKVKTSVPVLERENHWAPYSMEEMATLKFKEVDSLTPSEVADQMVVQFIDRYLGKIGESWNTSEAIIYYIFNKPNLFDRLSEKGNWRNGLKKLVEYDANHPEQIPSDYVRFAKRRLEQ